MFGLQLCLSSLGLDVHSDMVLLRNGMSGLNLSRLSLDVQSEAVAVRSALGYPVFGCVGSQAKLCEVTNFGKRG